MAIYHCSVKNISRSGGKSAVASASYRAGEKLEDRETGLTHYYTNKSEVAYSEIFLCENAPSEYQDRETLWNAVGKWRSRATQGLRESGKWHSLMSLPLNRARSLSEGTHRALLMRVCAWMPISTGKTEITTHTSWELQDR